MPKKQTQRGCALSKKRRKHHNKSVKQCGGDLHKMYSINNLAQDPQRMMTIDRGVVQMGGSSEMNKHIGAKGKKHARKYLKHGGSALKHGGSALKHGGSALKHGGSALAALNTVIDQVSTRYMSSTGGDLSKSPYSLV
jgi:hypothetical protein